MLARTTIPSPPSPPPPDAGRGHRAGVGQGAGGAGEALCGRAPAPARGHLPAVPRRGWRAPLTRGWRCFSRRPTPTPAKTCWNCRPTAGRWCCSCCWRAAWRRATGAPGHRPARPARPARGPAGRIHRAGLSQRQDRPGAGRGHCRPDRRQHRSGGAQRQPLAGGRVSRTRSMPCATRSSTCACWWRPRWTSPKKKSTSCKRPTRAASLRACSKRWRR
jgi:hypothetical protein